jgi:hypothetical protein
LSKNTFQFRYPFAGASFVYDVLASVLAQSLPHEGHCFLLPSMRRRELGRGKARTIAVTTDIQINASGLLAC